MSLFFPDLNVWVALSVARHSHHETAWKWLRWLGRETQLVFSRYTQIGLLRLLTNQSVMGDRVLTLRQAWHVYDRWLDDPRVDFYPEPREIDGAFRQTTAAFGEAHASKSVGDCYLLAYAKQSGATLVTFDAALEAHARRQGHPSMIPH